MTIELGATLFKVVLFIYAVSTLCYLSNFLKAQKAVGQAATALAVAGFALHTATLAVRWVAAGRPPFLNLYEYMMSLTWGLVLVYLFSEFTTKNKRFGVFVMPLVLLGGLYTVVVLSSVVNPTMPALMSDWRVPHIVTAILAYSAFALAFGLAIMYLLREAVDTKPESFWASRIPSTGVLDKLIYRILAFGFLMHTIMMITGAVWAQNAWGRYWGWDAKETWGLVTWLIYAAYMHMRVTLGWRGRKSAIVVIIGFVATIFTLLGVSFWLPGLHSYAG